ncbi:1-acyl-sn-glycerol-3-phosphate acyltransferase [Caballeronia sp. LP003]|uniref:1-acyl-sn-glycerol-3-phosphate acyltransferase n=1 Tax=Caballeronia sp. LP003 TaxID=3038551 RepID=UPI002863B64B|nr:1-acyl-sn-glycerol-3-phosphate acyltransferase [Caballeronia sp. LP003]MDR5791689.1 1-acyl-sn-glycerol-3-phosphate acyltransferase [Caballeronia sp. LP003]
MRQFLKTILANIGLSVFRVKVTYSAQARAAIASGKCVIHANHVSLLDGVIVALASPAPLVFAVDTDFSRRSRIARFGLSALSKAGFGAVVPLDASAPFGMRALKRVLAQGGNVMVFPEGRISPNGSRQTDMPGLNWLARSTGADLVEVVISGAEESKLFARAGSKLWPKITLRFGEFSA